MLSSVLTRRTTPSSDLFQGERESYNGLGIIWRDGLGVKADLAKAQEYFQAAADQDLGEAHVNLGKLALGE